MKNQETTHNVTLRYAAATDARSLERLAALDSAPTPNPPALLAEVDGRLRAALPLDGGDPIADPFYPTAGLIELLLVRGQQLAGHGRVASPFSLRAAFGLHRGLDAAREQTPPTASLAVHARRQ